MIRLKLLKLNILVYGKRLKDASHIRLHCFETCLGATIKAQPTGILTHERELVPPAGWTYICHLP